MGKKFSSGSADNCRLTNCGNMFELAVDDIVSSRSTLPCLDNPLSKALNDFINFIRKQRGAFMRTRVLKHSDDSLEAFVL